MSSSSVPRVTAEKLGPVEGLAEKMTFTSIQTGAPAGNGLQQNSLSRYNYGPSSPCSPHSPRVGEALSHQEAGHAVTPLHCFSGVAAVGPVFKAERLGLHEHKRSWQQCSHLLVQHQF
ncbi:hypothetical protein ABPG77_007228 [Micractinium sp. CCAP 211/92]